MFQDKASLFEITGLGENCPGIELQMWIVGFERKSPAAGSCSLSPVVRFPFCLVSAPTCPSKSRCWALLHIFLSKLIGVEIAFGKQTGRDQELGAVKGRDRR